ncbi:MAG: outer membrane beta-barrel family protein, partial [Bacteroidota bacterium]|nr:outer membrane beta-barrel family protein [Bacteroidota bacterium]MDX5429835.1 outer membrane beta-barrel family protein [Bacteroidota bacterium]MDX5468614.1 outer membrane beta-barrel family protein [Bacteroidota bacterium]
TGDQTYEELTTSTSSNINHRVNFRMEYTIDSFNSIIFTPRLSFQGNVGNNQTSGINYLGSQWINQTLNTGFKDQSGLNYSHDLLLRHRFKKEGRTLSLSVDQGYADNRYKSTLYAGNRFALLQGDSLAEIDQIGEGSGINRNIGGRLMYTEPLGKVGQITLNYSPSRTYSTSNNATFGLDTLTQSYSNYDSLLSGDLSSITDVQRAGVGLRFRKDKWTMFAMLNYQFSQLQANQEIPSSFEVNKGFDALLPFAFMRYEFSKNDHLRLFYRTSTDLPSGSQLRNTVDNSNPLLLSTGNANLDQSYAHRLGLRFNKTNPLKARTFFMSVDGNYQNNYIASSSYLSRVDTIIEGIDLARGAQLNRPVNLDKFWSASTFMSFGLPVKWMKSNFNGNINISYTNTPGLINEVLNYTRATSLNLSAVLSSNISENLDFTLSYAVDLNRVRNTFQPQLNNDYLLHAGTAGITWLHKKGLLMNSQASYTSYVGLGEAFNTDYLIWNAAIGYKFLKNDAMDVRVSVFDLLG